METHKDLKCTNFSVYTSSECASKVSLHAAIILSTTTPALITLPFSSGLSFVPTAGLSLLLTLQLMCYRQSNAVDIGKTVSTAFIKALSRSVTMTFGITFCSTNKDLHIPKAHVKLSSFSHS